MGLKTHCSDAQNESTTNLCHCCLKQCHALGKHHPIGWCGEAERLHEPPYWQTSLGWTGSPGRLIYSVPADQSAAASCRRGVMSLLEVREGGVWLWTAGCREGFGSVPPLQKPGWRAPPWNFPSGTSWLAGGGTIPPRQSYSTAREHSHNVT